MTISTDSTVVQLKDIIHEKTEIAKENIRLIFKGRILKDEQTIADVKIENGVTVVLVNTSADA